MLEEEFSPQPRTEFKKELQSKVDIAFEKRAIETMTPDGLTTEECIKRCSQGLERFQDKPDDLIVVFGDGVSEGPAEECEVIVYNLTDFYVLLKMTMRKIWPDGDEEFIEYNVDTSFMHEEEHWNTYSSLNTKSLGVRFFEDKITKQCNFTPFVRVWGEVPLGLLRKEHSDPSLGDIAKSKSLSK